MQTKIRHIARKRKGIVTENEKLVNKQTITIGRATDQDVFLSDLGVSYRHARLAILPDHSVNISSTSNIGFYLDGVFTQNGIIKNSAEIIIGAYSLKVKIDKQKFILEITIEKIADDIVQMQSDRMLPTQLHQTQLSKRRLAWLSFTLLIVLFLALPVVSFFNHDAKVLAESLMLPDDDVWLSGELSSSHQHLSGDCNVCHKKAFEIVQDNACTNCHKNISVHADPDIFNLPELQSQTCTSCHKEHNGDDFIIVKNQLMCSECHKNLSNRVDTDLVDSSDFEADHAQFKASLRTQKNMSKTDPQAWQRISLDDINIKHQTNLIFPHDIHLDINGVNSPQGNKVLICNDCHQSDSSGNYMLPVVMGNHCQSCHRLEFDTEDLERELPHSDLKNMRKMLDEYYSLIALRGSYDEDEAPDLIKNRHRPGKALTKDEQLVALKWAQDKAQDVAEEVVEFRSCNLCHKLEADSKSELGWIIPAVSISQDRWLPKAKFEHETHISTTCETCHDAKKSKISEDVLLPKIEVCRECHGGQDSEQKLKSSCISCHDFHQSNEMLMKHRNMGD